jgi:molybdenum cofactor cytidylyltransferase
MIFALVPAAGQSVRMGRPKLALPLGGRTVLELVVVALHGGGVQSVLVVVGPHVPELVPLAEAAGASVLSLCHETPDMRATVEAGLQWLEDHVHPKDEDDWLLVPADHPALDSGMVGELLAARSRHPRAGIIIPVYKGQRGHPTLITWRHVAGIRRFALGQGLNAYLRLHAADTLELPVTSPHVLCDLDTHEDYERLRRPLAAPRPASVQRE